MSDEVEKGEGWQGRKGVLVNSTGAIGDTVVFTAVQHALSERGYDVGLTPVNFAHNLLDGLGHVLDQTKYDTTGTRVDSSRYLTGFPHTTAFLEGRFGHLCEWMGRSISEQLGIDLLISRDNVRIVLTAEEIAMGEERVQGVKSNYGSRQLVIICPVSTTKNRNISVDQVTEIVKGVSDISTPVLLEPVPEKYKETVSIVMGSKNLREVAAILLAADSVVAVDSGPLHLAAGAVQGNPGETNAVADKIVAVVGSSRPEVVTYKRNQVVFPKKVVCGLAPCGAHGYHSLPQYSIRLEKEFHPSGSGTDKSGCVLTDYSQAETAACMAAISVQEIIDKIRHHLEYRQK